MKPPTMKDIMASNNTYVMHSRNALSGLLNRVSIDELDAILTKSDKECAIHEYLGKHIRRQIKIGHLPSGLNYKIFMCPCGAFSCENSQETLSAVWGLASHEPAITYICQLITQLNSPSIAVLWLSYVHSVNSNLGNMSIFVEKDMNL